MSEYSETLVSPDGRTVIARTPGEANDLRFGQGYRTATEQEKHEQQAEPTSEPTPEPTQEPGTEQTPAEEPAPMEAPEKSGRRAKSPEPAQDTK